MVSKPLPILFFIDDNFLIYSYILFSATFVDRYHRTVVLAFGKHSYGEIAYHAGFSRDNRTYLNFILHYQKKTSSKDPVDKPIKSCGKP